MDQRNSTLAVPEKRSPFARQRSGHSVVGSARLEKGQQLPLLASFIADVQRLPDVQALSHDDLERMRRPAQQVFKLEELRN